MRYSGIAFSGVPRALGRVIRSDGLLCTLKVQNWLNFRNSLWVIVIDVQVGPFVTWYPLPLLALCAVIFDARRLSVDEVCLCAAYMACSAAYVCFLRGFATAFT